MVNRETATSSAFVHSEESNGSSIRSSYDFQNGNTTLSDHVIEHLCIFLSCVLFWAVILAIACTPCLLSFYFDRNYENKEEEQEQSNSCSEEQSGVDCDDESEERVYLI